MTEPAQALHEVRERIAHAAKIARRNPRDIDLIA
ncbi:MAG: YggS family pyridoxal phosphate-dependent enzyme, partial [Alphaproteobacteria bacterium]|nr:YggS family pyridoxal phosphate-dependent enzyme [Alphaproteobacteria bacterium]